MDTNICFLQIGGLSITNWRSPDILINFSIKIWVSAEACYWRFVATVMYVYVTGK